MAFDIERKAPFGGYCLFLDQELHVLGTSMDKIRDDREQPIALCEAAMVPLTLLQDPAAFRGRTIIWYVDNTVATASFVKGSSGNLRLQKIVHLFWMLTYLLEIEVWFEWVESKANWSDGISRTFEKDVFARDHGFTTEPFLVDMHFWMDEPHKVWVQLSAMCA